MGKLIDLTGKKFGMMTVVRQDGRAKNGKVKWLCLCDCGEIRSVDGTSLRTGHTRSCGCQTAERNKNRVKNLTGKRFHRLVVVCRYGTNKHRKAIWKCLCDCGNYVFATTGELRSGNTKSCGCFSRGLFVRNRVTHGKSRTIEYMCWINMKKRCYVQNASGYNNYGGRGITVCDRWINSFENFYEDVGDRPSHGHSLDRIDVNGNYDPLNCKWSTRTEQALNKRTKEECERDRALMKAV